MKVQRVVMVVLDGLGIGAMDDADERDREADTLRHVADGAGGLDLPNLAALGLGEVANLPSLSSQAEKIHGARAIARLGYPGADTYLGHQELMGAPLAEVELHMLAQRRDRIRARLAAEGHATTDALAGTSALLVDGTAVVADNIEAAAGLNINVTGSLDQISFEDLLAIGRSVRGEVSVPRVIVVAGRGFRAGDIVTSIRTHGPGHAGVDTPGLGVYDANYLVRHLGVAAPSPHTLPNVVRAGGGQVVLLGKAADVVECDDAIRDPAIPAAAVLGRAMNTLTPEFAGLLVANIQETDLAGHEQDAPRFRRVLEEVDRAVPALVARLGDEGLLFVVADHGNDPAAGHSQHTRELTPLLVAGAQVQPANLGVRASLSDAAATIVQLLAVRPVAEGIGFADRLVGRQTIDRSV